MGGVGHGTQIAPETPVGEKTLARRDPSALLPDRPLGGLEADLGMGSVAEGLGRGTPAAAQGGYAAIDAVLRPVRVLDGYRAPHDVRPVFPDLDGHCIFGHGPGLHQRTPVVLSRRRPRLLSGKLCVPNIRTWA